MSQRLKRHMTLLKAADCDVVRKEYSVTNLAIGRIMCGKFVVEEIKRRNYIFYPEMRSPVRNQTQFENLDQYMHRAIILVSFYTKILVSISTRVMHNSYVIN